MSFMKAILAATWAAVLFVASIPASAAQLESNTRSASVGYSDLNLTAADGVSTLKQRVSGAIHQVCDGPAFELRDKLDQRACQRAAGTVASKDVENAIATAKQQSSTKSKGTASIGAVDKTISGSSRQLWNRRDRIPQH
jgi:UrcA family protein